MMRYLLGVLSAWGCRGAFSVVLLFSGFCGQVQALTPVELFAKTSPSVWRIRTFDKEGLPLAGGSAVVIGNETLVTNCHVLSKSGRFSVIRDNTSLGGTLEMWDTERDLCQIKARNLNAPAVKLGSSASLVVGQNVYTLGNPRDLELTLSAGLVSSLRRDEKEQLALIQTSAPISMGSSGGGLFDEQGRLIGLTTLTVKDGQNLNFAIPADWIRELPARHQLALQKKETDKALAQEKNAVGVGGQSQGKTWRYEYRDTYNKRREIAITSRTSGNESIAEEASVGAVDVGSLQWTPSSPILRSRAASGIEWVEISPYFFSGASSNRSLGRREISAFGSDFTLTLREYGEESVSVGAGVFAASRLEIVGERKSGGPSTGAPAIRAVRVVAWYSKELARVIKVSFVSTALDTSKLDKYDMTLTGVAK